MAATHQCGTTAVFFFFLIWVWPCSMLRMLAAASYCVPLISVVCSTPTSVVRTNFRVFLAAHTHGQIDLRHLARNGLDSTLSSASWSL
jgi:hypothetical protein